MFISAFLAGTILPFSSEAVLLACVGLGLDPVWSTISTTAGNALGGITCYWIGHLGKIEWIEKYLRVDKKQMDRAERFIRGRGSWMALFSFLPVIGDAILIVLGWMRANVWIVALSMTIGKLARYAILVAATLGVFELF
jgi:membrane protein YqaA with SNARE-associated domain